MQVLSCCSFSRDNEIVRKLHLKPVSQIVTFRSHAGSRSQFPSRLITRCSHLFSTGTSPIVIILKYHTFLINLLLKLPKNLNYLRILKSVIL
jgi:hypothetical protein